MKIYWVKNHGFENMSPIIESAEVVKETEQFYTVSTYGPSYTQRQNKSQLGFAYFLTEKDAVEGFLKSLERRVQDAEHRLQKERSYLDEASKWATELNTKAEKES